MQRSLEVSQFFPSEYYPSLGIMVKNFVDLASRRISCDILSPKPFMPPIPGLPYWKMSLLPRTKQFPSYTVHMPRYLYPLPKRWFFHRTGDFFASSIRQYLPHLQPPDIVHAHFSYPEGYACAILKDSIKAPLVIHARGTNERILANTAPLIGEKIRQGFDQADAVIANSFELQRCCRALGVSRAKIHVIPNGVDTGLFRPKNKKQMRKQLGLPADKCIVLYVGMLREIKGCLVLARAAEEVLRHKPDAFFVFVGDGELSTVLKKSFPQKSVLFAGARPYEEIPFWMNAADILVLPSLSEARSNVIPEALSCGIPVVASDVGGIPEVMRSSHGIMVKPGDSPELSGALIKLIDSPDLIHRLGLRARDFVVNSGLTWQSHTEKTLKLYSTLV